MGQTGRIKIPNFHERFLRFASVYVLKNKSQVHKKFKEFVASPENHIGKRKRHQERGTLI